MLHVLAAPCREQKPSIPLNTYQLHNDAAPSMLVFIEDFDISCAINIDFVTWGLTAITMMDTFDKDGAD